ncbi:MAG: SRPBCC family protein [Actinomycetia bacterium]|nr:SRPBCC family protein [Actinomycetes bacterium]
MTETEAAPTPFERAHDIEIGAPAATVLDYVSNPLSWPEWMPATHEILSDDRPLQAGEGFSERWATRKGEVGLEWRVTERIQPTLWVAETDTPFTGPIVARYEIDELGPDRCRYTRRIVNPARPKAPTDEMVERMDAEASICLANIKRVVESRVSRAARP